ncbi:potassium-dependent ATPase G chain [Scytonema sp. HK-05]|uniref:potassium-transporting ATPase subunit F n=1 Tax=Scytonema sp. HK-05 TaxID=1137095 RepID=UPI000936918C|nr:potassium-transporting ATPase subunit F [Scytonema sp. HK-05]OKH59830.1 ATPase [Scytonema sp. HK-05]BAY43097.1 potassium-dependent ATPase G chain [Scytonema sp. HK-05]
MKKKVDVLDKFLPMDVMQAISFVWSEWRSQKLPLAIFVALCLNLLIAPIVYAAADGTLERRSAWAIGVLGLVTLAVIVYLFVVVFQPERF